METSQKIKFDQIYLPSGKIISRLIDDTLIIIPIESATGIVDFDESLYSLEDIGREIWEKLTHEITVSKLCADLADRYNASLETISRDVEALLKDLLEKGLIVPQGS